MKMTELLAQNRTHYVDIALRLGTDPVWRAQMSAMITERVGLLW